MKLSFVIPAHNEEKYIAQCLESVIREAKKTRRDVEIIVVNNASTDKTREIALSFSEVKVVDEPRKGLPQARQAGFLASSGDLIANVDADSIIPSFWIEKVFDHFSRNEKLVALSGPYIYYDLFENKKLFGQSFLLSRLSFESDQSFSLRKGGDASRGKFHFETVGS